MTQMVRIGPEKYFLEFGINQAEFGLQKQKVGLGIWH
jgi:hypothetical protein